MIGKIIAYGSSRADSIARMRAALRETVVDGTKTNVPLHEALFDDPEFIGGAANIHFPGKLDLRASRGKKPAGPKFSP